MSFIRCLSFLTLLLMSAAYATAAPEAAPPSMRFSVDPLFSSAPASSTATANNLPTSSSTAAVGRSKVFYIRLLAESADADEVQGVDGAQRRSVLNVLDGASIGATKQFAAPVGLCKKSTLDHKAITPSFVISRSLVSKMLATLVCAVTGKKNTIEAWQSLIKTGPQGDVVGIKVATESGLLAGTHRELIKALVEELTRAGVTPANIIVWDRREEELQAAGYRLEKGLQLQWIEHGSGYDLKESFSSPLIGQLVYGDAEFREEPHSFEEWQTRTSEQLSNQSHYALLLTQRINKVINVPSLCDSSYCGIQGALVNMTLGVVDNWRRFVKESRCGDPTIPTLYGTEQIKSKVIFTIMDALAMQYAGGPGAAPSHTIPYGALLASQDPVALDATALRLLNNERHLQKLPEIRATASHLERAEALGLGRAAEKEIELISVSKSAALPLTKTY